MSTMPVVWFSIVIPLPGERPRVEQLLDELDNLYSSHEGYIAGGRFTAEDSAVHQEGIEMGSISLWRSRDDADHASADTQVAAIRSQIQQVIVPGQRVDRIHGHLERLYDLTEGSRLASIQYQPGGPLILPGQEQGGMDTPPIIERP